jgi:hypothetical protein
MTRRARLHELRDSEFQTSPIFIVGCSRAGTTVLQSVLNNHPAIQAFPETNILFRSLNSLDYRRYGLLADWPKIPLGVVGVALNRSGITTKNPTAFFERFLSDKTGQWSPTRSRFRMRFIKSIFADFCSMMTTISSGGIWLEKSPQNIFCLDLIDKYIQDARVLHIVRDQNDNIASLFDAANKYDVFARRFGGKKGLRKAIHYYNGCLKISHKYKEHPNHVIIRYEDFVKHPLASLAPISALLRIDFSPDMFVYNTRGLQTPSEVWKNNDRNISPQRSKLPLFSSRQIQLVARYALDADTYFPPGAED